MRRNVSIAYCGDRSTERIRTDGEGRPAMVFPLVPQACYGVTRNWNTPVRSSVVLMDVRTPFLSRKEVARNW